MSALQNHSRCYLAERRNSLHAEGTPVCNSRCHYREAQDKSSEPQEPTGFKWPSFRPARRSCLMNNRQRQPCLLEGPLT